MRELEKADTRVRDPREGAMSATWISNIPSLQRALRVEADERSAAIQLVAVAGPGRVADLMPEVERRSELFKSEWLTSPRGHSETPMTAALRSVTNDVARGWLA